MRKALLVILVLLLASAPAVFSQSKETGAIRGVVYDEQNSPLPGASVTLSGTSLMGIRTFVTDANGEFRFPALPPGVYQVKAELSGFAPYVRENIRLNTTVTLTADVVLRVASIQEEVTVIAESPTVDIRSTETASVTLTNEILRNIPYSQFTADIVNMAPGINDDVAFGASSGTGLGYTMDGVGVADPSGGTAWVFLDHNIIAEAKVMGHGLPAEYGNTTGVIFNLITKSGGNEFSGHIEFSFQGQRQDSKFWQAENNAAYIDDFPDLSSASLSVLDASFHLGGPIVRDKLWFYVGGQWYRTKDRPAGFPEDIDYKQPHGFLKLSAQVSPTLSLMASAEIDQYRGINRDGGATVAPEATVTQDSPELVGNISLTKILSSRTFFDLKGALFSGYYYLDPEVGFEPYMHYDFAENVYRQSSGYFYYADRFRYQANASMTHYVEDFISGSHDFKFGAEFERSGARDRYGYTGEGGDLGDHVLYYDYYGEPYLAYQNDGYDTKTTYTRLEGFLQDAWQVMDRLNLNVGVRFSQYWGQVKDRPGNVYSAGRISPRLGFTFDILGDKTTILKGHYGQFSEVMLVDYHDRMNPSSAYSDEISYWWDGDVWEEFSRTVYEDIYRVDPDIKHPYMEQFTLGIERELFKDASLGVTYIHRNWKNQIGPVDLAADYDTLDFDVPYSDDTITVYERTEDTVNTFDYLITNFTTASSPWIFDNPYRRFQGIELLFNKRYSNRWQLLASYVYSKSKGTIDNGTSDDIGYGTRDGNQIGDPNYWTNADGNSTYTPTHMLKIQASYLIPVIDVSFNAYFRGISGRFWTTRFRSSFLNQGRVTVFTEPRGSNHYPMQKILDLRLEKIFTIASKYRLGFLIDVFNVFNADTVSSWGTRIGYDWNPGDYASTAGHELYGLVLPRQARVGVRLIF